MKISKIDNRKIQEINKTKSLFFEKINKIDKPQARLKRKRRPNCQYQKLRDSTTGPADIKA